MCVLGNNEKMQKNLIGKLHRIFGGIIIQKLQQKEFTCINCTDASFAFFIDFFLFKFLFQRIISSSKIEVNKQKNKEFSHILFPYFEIYYSLVSWNHNNKRHCYALLLI